MGITRNVDGVIPTIDGQVGVAYAPFPKLTTPTDAIALSEDPKGNASIVTKTGTNRLFVGQSTSIVEMDATFAPVTVGSGLTAHGSDDWVFTHYGQFLLTTNINNGVWSYNVETSTAVGNVTTAPKAREIFAANEMIIALACDGDNMRWQNCALGDHTNWTTREANGDSLESGKALVTGRYLGNGRSVVFQRSAVNIFSSNGGTISVSKISGGIGSVGRRSVTSFNGLAYFLDTKGFFVTDGATTKPIGDEKIDETFLATVTEGELENVDVGIDPYRKLVMWYYGGTVWVYHWVLGEWSKFTETLTSLTRVASSGYTMDNIDSFGTMETIPYSFDDRFWQGEALSLGAFKADKKIAFFSGQNRAATIDTALQNMGISTLVNSATPLTDDSGVTLAIGKTDIISTDPAFGSDIAVQPSGRCPVRGRGKNITFRQKHAEGATWNNARGIDHIESSGGGKR